MPIAHTFGPDGSGSGNPFSDDDDDKKDDKKKDDKRSDDKKKDDKKDDKKDPQEGFPTEFYPPPLVPQLLQSPYPGMPPVPVMAPQVMLPDPEEQKEMAKPKELDQEIVYIPLDSEDYKE